MDAQKTGTLIAQARRERGLTQKELSQALHVSAQAVSKWERGLNFPDLSLLEPLGDCLAHQQPQGVQQQLFSGLPAPLS